jgi:dihydropyrimidinase
VIVNGRVQFNDGKLDVTRGAGRYLPRKLDKGFATPVKESRA